MNRGSYGWSKEREQERGMGGRDDSRISNNSRERGSERERDRESDNRERGSDRGNDRDRDREGLHVPQGVGRGVRMGPLSPTVVSQTIS